MVLVAPARDHHQQNLVAFQYNSAIYFFKNVPTLEEETPPSGRQLRPRICPTCRQQRRTCTCSSPSTRGRQTSRSPRSTPGSAKHQLGRPRQAARTVSGTSSEVTLPVAADTEAASFSLTLPASQPISSGSISKASSSDISAQSLIILEAKKSEETQSEYASSSKLMEEFHTSEVSQRTSTEIIENISHLDVSPRLDDVRTPASYQNVSSEGILGSGLRSVASRKEYTSHLTLQTGTSSLSVEGSQSISTLPQEGIVQPLSFQRKSEISGESSSSSGIHILKSKSIDNRALESFSGIHDSVEKLEEKMLDISTVSAMEGSSSLTTKESFSSSTSEAPIDVLTSPASSKSRFLSLRSSARPSTMRTSLRSKFELGLAEGSKKRGQTVKRAFEEELLPSEEEGPKTKKDIKNEENIQRQKEKSMSESSHEKDMEGSTSLVSSGDSALDVESELLEKRIEGDKTKASFTCPICQLVVSDLLHFKEHLESHSGTSGSSLKELELPSENLLSNPGDDDDDDDDDEGRKKVNHTCPICFKTFNSPGMLSHHLESHTGSSSKIEESLVSGGTFRGGGAGGSKRRSGHTCRVCSKVFVSPGRLSNHMYSAHPGLSGSSTSAGEVATTSGVFVSGGSGVKRKGSHVCPVCSKVFGSPGKLSQHMYSHTGERPFACTECNKAFSSKFKLVRHALIHSSDSERRYRCNACDRSFHRKDHLQNHAKVHSVVRARWRCDRCGREYGSPLSHRRHLALHAAQDDGALDCGVCGRHFNTTPDILHHLKVHAGSRTVKSPADRKFRCEHCDRRFFTRKDVRRHLVVHTGKRDFLCQFCPQRFGRKDHLVRHIKKSHHQGSLPSTARGARGGRRHKLTVTAAALGKSGVSGSSTSATETGAVEELHPHSALYGTSSRVEDVILIPRTSSFIESKVEERTNLPQGSMLEEASILSRSQIVASEGSLKIPSIETMLHAASPGYAGESTGMPGTSDVIPKSEEASLLPAVGSAGPSLEMVYAHPPPPYPSEGLQTQTYKVYEEGSREGMIKLEPSSSTRVSDIAHLLGLIPSTSQSSVLSETLSGVDQESLLMATQHLRTDEDIQRLLSGGTEQSQLLTTDEQQLLQFVESAASSVVGLELGSGESSGVPGESDVMASLLASNAGQRNVGATSTTPLPRFTQAFQSQQQQQPQQQPQPPPPPSSSQQQQEQR
ncbi:hypothetical protein C0J52_07901 [Blattella germanica]|nr:hypothetical protein C0J52_07901 [Blattella germanica]